MVQEELTIKEEENDKAAVMQEIERRYGDVSHGSRVGERKGRR